MDSSQLSVNIFPVTAEAATETAGLAAPQCSSVAWQVSQKFCPRISTMLKCHSDKAVRNPLKGGEVHDCNLLQSYSPFQTIVFEMM